MHQTLPNHLGGHCNITHIDEHTLNYLISKYSVKTMYDVGCGPGSMVKLAKNKNVDCIGIDGDFTIKYPKDLNIIIHDFTLGTLNVEKRDLAWSCEFLEHVEEKFMNNYFSVFKKCSVVCCTFSMSHRGYHHVNVKDQKYWDEKFKINGFTKDLESTKYIRQNSSMKRNFVRETGTVFINNE